MVIGGVTFPLRQVHWTNCSHNDNYRLKFKITGTTFRLYELVVWSYVKGLLEVHFSLLVLTHVKVFLSGPWPEIALSVNPFVSGNCYSKTFFPGRVWLFETYFAQLTVQFLCLFKLNSSLLKPCHICVSGWVNLFYVCFLHFRIL